MPTFSKTMIYVDDIIYWPGDVAPRAQKFGRQWCHLWCDPGEEEELHKFAEKIGLKREYFQIHKVVNHYDLVPSKMALAIFYGATPLQMIEWLKSRRSLTALKIIFLDFDGVVNRFDDPESLRQLSPRCIEILNSIIEKTNASIVITSTWRILRSIVDLKQILVNAGFKFPNKIIGKTPRGKTRGDEIAFYLKNITSCSNYLYLCCFSSSSFYKSVCTLTISVF